MQEDAKKGGETDPDRCDQEVILGDVGEEREEN